MSDEALAIALGLSPSQFQNALGIIAAVKKRGWSSKAAVIAIETALAESGMRMIASANVPESQKYPHEPLSWTSDGLGHDHASMGMFQQQTGYAWALAGTSTMNSPDGWGTPAELMDPEKSTEKFLDAMAAHNWESGVAWQIAQAVQGSAYADGSNYRAQDTQANEIVAKLWTINPAGDTDMTPEQAKQLDAIYRSISVLAHGDAQHPNSEDGLAARLARIEAAQQATDAKVDRVLSRFVGSDGVSHTVESVVAHVAKGLQYLSKKGRNYA